MGCFVPWYDLMGPKLDLVTRLWPGAGTEEGSL
jgi:hypothetical protein